MVRKWRSSDKISSLYKAIRNTKNKKKPDLRPYFLVIFFKYNFYCFRNEPRWAEASSNRRRDERWRKGKRVRHLGPGRGTGTSQTGADWVHILAYYGEEIFFHYQFGFPRWCSGTLCDYWAWGLELDIRAEQMFV